MSTTETSLIRMANDIARNLAARGEAVAIAATAEHIAKFWDPRMKAGGFALLENGGDNLSPIARAALTKLKNDA